MNPVEWLCPSRDFLFWKKEVVVAFKFKRIELYSKEGCQNDYTIGISLFFDPMDFRTEEYKKIEDIVRNISSPRLSPPQYDRVGKNYTLTVASPVPSELTKEEFFKQIVDIFYNPTRAIMNIKSKEPLIRFISNVVVMVDDV